MVRTKEETKIYVRQGVTDLRKGTCGLLTVIENEMQRSALWDRLRCLGKIRCSTEAGKVPKAAAGFWHWLKLQKSTIWARKIICVVFLSARLIAKQLKTDRNFYRGLLKLHRSSHRANGFLIKMKSIRYWFRLFFLCVNFRGDLTVTFVRMPDLLIDLQTAVENKNLPRVMKKYTQPVLLIIDEWLLLKLTAGRRKTSLWSNSQESF